MDVITSVLRLCMGILVLAILGIPYSKMNIHAKVNIVLE